MVSKITYELLKNSDVFKNIPILTLDERWYHLINEKNKTDEIAYWEKQVNELLKKQGRINNDIKDIKKLKKQLINDVVENMEEDDSSRQKQKRMSQNQRLIQESNDNLSLAYRCIIAHNHMFSYNLKRSLCNASRHYKLWQE